MARELLDESTARAKRSSATRTRRGAGRPSFTALLPPVIAALVAIAVWEAAVRLSAVPDYIVPAPSAIAGALIAHPSRFASAGLRSLLEAVGGLTVGAGAAFALAVVMAHSRALERALYPLALLVKVTPVIAVAPLLIIWFGFGATPKVLIAALITFFPMLVNAVTGLRSVPASTLDVFRSLDASPVQTFWHLRVPSSLPYVVAALKISIPLSLIGAVVAEWMSGDGGIGLIILIANSDFDTASLFAAVVVLAVIAVTLTALVSFIERRVLWWHESADIS